MMKKRKMDILLKLMSNIQKNYLNFVVTYHFDLEQRNLRKSKILVLIKVIKVNMLLT